MSSAPQAEGLPKDTAPESVEEISEGNPVTMAVVGCAGQGKSTLVNSLLLMDRESDEAAEEGDVGETVTKIVGKYSK